MTAISAGQPKPQHGNPSSGLTVVQKRVALLTAFGSLLAIALVTFPNLF